jgi:hypothetical protein
MQQGRIFRCHEFLRCFFGASACSGTPWFTEYTSQISMSNTSFHVRRKFGDHKKNPEGQAIVIKYFLFPILRFLTALGKRGILPLSPCSEPESGLLG